jgi:hypothetical protein
MNYCKFDNVKLVAVNNSSLALIVFHHRFEELIEGCLRVASQYRFQNAPCTTQFHIERDGAFLLNKHGKRTTV